jgi:hypothetical protein
MNPVNPVLEATSNNVFALPGATSATQAGSGSRGSGGFASTLAVAQGVSNTSPAAAAADAMPAQTQTAGTAPNGSAGKLAAVSLPLKKLPSGCTPVAAQAEAVANVVVPASGLETASQIPSAGLQPSFVPLSFMPSSLAPTSTAASAAQSPAHSAAFNSVAPVPAANFLGSWTAARATPDNLGASSNAVVSLSNQSSGPVSGPDTTTAAGAVASTFSTARQPTSTPLPASPGVVRDNQWKGFEKVSPGAESVWPAGNIQAATPSVSTAQAWSGASLASSDPAIQNGEVQTRTIAPSLGAPGPVASGLVTPGLGAPGYTPQGNSNEVPQSPTAAPVLLASAATQLVPAGGLPVSGMNLQSAQENTSDAMGSYTASTQLLNQDEPALPAGAASAVPEIVNAQNSAAAILNASSILNSPPLPAGTSSQFAAARVNAGVSATNVRGAAVSPAATSSSAKPSWIPAPEAAASELPVANQTPFSVFFSSVGPGTEAAASTLPKMILPAGGFATRSSVTTVSGPQANGPQAGSSQAGGSQAVGGASSVTPNAAPQPSKDALAAGSPAATASAGQALHNNADQSSSNVAAAASSSPAAAAAPLAAAGAAVPAAPPGLTNDSSPKQGAVPGSATSGAGGALPAAPPPAAAALPGPVQVAQMVNRVGQSEMRIGMNTSAFGGVEVRTVVHANDVGLIIGSEKGDLRGLLANEMPAIANTLQQQNLRLSSVNFMQGFASSNNASGGESQQQQQRSFVPASASSNPAPSEAMVDDSVETLPTAGFGGGGYGLRLGLGLSILA